MSETGQREYAPQSRARPRVAMVSTWPGDDERKSGGLARYARELVRIVTPVADVTVLSDRSRGMVVDEPHVVPVWQPGILSGRSIGRAIEHVAPEIVHVQHELFLYGSALSAMVFPLWLRSLARRRPTVVTVHGVIRSREVDPRLLRGRAPLAAAGIAARIMHKIFQRIAESPATKIVHATPIARRLIEYGAREEDIIVSPLMAMSAFRHQGNETKTRDAARSDLQIPSGAKVVLTWGFLNVYKGFDVLLDAFKIFRVRHDDAVLLLGIGKHPKLHRDRRHIDEYARLAKQAEGVGAVRFLGFIPDAILADRVAAADVTIFPYTRYVAPSGLPLDAAALGAPVLLSSVFEDAPPLLKFAPTADSIAAKLEAFFASPRPFAEETKRLGGMAVVEDAIRDAHGRAYARAMQRFAQR